VPFTAIRCRGKCSHMPIFFLCLILAVVAIVTLPWWLDRTLVRMTWPIVAAIYPLSSRIAYSLVNKPDEWHLDDADASHPTIGKIRGGQDAFSIRVQLPDTNQSRNQTWRPNWIERRIIYDALSHLIGSRRKAKLDQTLPNLPW